MGDEHEGASEPGQPRLQPLDPLQVQVVGGLVQQQHVGSPGEEACQPQPRLFAAAEGSDRPVVLQRIEPPRPQQRVDAPVYRLRKRTQLLQG